MWLIDSHALETENLLSFHQIQWDWRKMQQCVQSAFLFLLVFFVFFFLFGSTDSKGVTHRTSVWLPERVGSGSALSEARRGSSAWSQWVTDPLADHVQLGDTPLEKHNKPASSGLPATSTCSVSNGTLSPISRVSEVTCEGEKKREKKARRCLQSWKWYPDGFKDWVQIMCMPACLTRFCNFLQMGQFEVNWSQGCGVPCTFLLPVVSHKEWWRTRVPTSCYHNGCLGVYCLLHHLESHPAGKDAHGGLQGNHEGGRGDMSVGKRK